MKIVKKEKKDVPAAPVSYNRSIMAAFEKQKKGKICPICTVKFSLATYKTHLEVCEVAENDEDIEILASYTGEEAKLIRAGPEIVLNDSEITEKTVETPQKRRKTEEPENPEEVDILEVPGPSKTAENSEKPIKSSPAWENRRRSARVARKSGISENPEKPPIKKEKATISEVLEAIQKFEEKTAQIQPRWPYYMRFSIQIMKKVISTRKFDGSFYDDDFWSPEDVITMYRFVEQLSEPAKCLLCRLFVRKVGWFHVEKLVQRYPEIPNLADAAIELTRWNFVNDDSCMKNLDEALALADVGILKNVARKFKIDTSKNRPELLQLLRKFAASQKSIFGGGGNVENSILRSLKQELGTCISIKLEIQELFKALFTIYCPSTTNSANAIENPSNSNIYQELLYMLQAIEKGDVRFPAPNPCPNITSFYGNRAMLFDYITAKSIEVHLVTFLAAGNLATALDLAIDAKELIEVMPGIQKTYYQNLPIHERKFTSIWVLTRCCGHGAGVLEKQKKYGMAVEWQKWLLTSEDVQHYCLDSRGIWWDRMLLNLDSHLKEKKECAKMIEKAMLDPTILEKELLSIQDRALKLKELPNFKPKISVGTPEKKTISAPVLTKNLGDGRTNRFVIRNEEKEEDVEVSVEEVVRLRYLEQEGFCVGVHDEGATWHTLFGLLFYDIIFPDSFPTDSPPSSESSGLDSSWLSEIQDAPTDLSNTLYSRRKEKFENRFEWLEEADEEQVEQNIRAIWELKKEETNRECNWKMFPNGVDDCVALAQCIPRPGLIAIFRRLAQNYRNCRSGFPDLTLWNSTTRKVAVVEVKGPGDRLSTKQRLWLAFFAENGIRAEVCHVTAENSKSLVN